MLDESHWPTHLYITGHVEQIREDTDLAGIDRLARPHAGQHVPPVRPRPDQRPWIALDGWHGRGALKDSSQAE